LQNLGDLNADRHISETLKSVVRECFTVSLNNLITSVTEYSNLKPEHVNVITSVTEYNNLKPEHANVLGSGA
jgi:hypothetical protein